MKTKLLFSATLAIVVLAAGAPLPARAQIAVLESSVANIKAGTRFENAERIQVPSGSAIRVVLPSGKTRTVRGPYDGTVAELTKGEPRNDGVMAWLTEFLKTGGARESTPGATRGFTAEAPKPVGFSWSAVPVAANATVCIDKSARLELVRSPSARPESVAIIDAASSARGEAQWEAGSTTAAWPAGLTPHPDRTYHVLIQGRPQRQITLRVLEKLPSDENVLAELHRLGCRQQFEAWVKRPPAR